MSLFGGNYFLVFLGDSGGGHVVVSVAQMTYLFAEFPGLSDQAISATKESWWECQVWSPVEPYRLCFVHEVGLA